jgi:hypothetical protein
MFTNLEKKVQGFMRDLTASIKNSMKMLETGAHRKNSVGE